MLWHDFISDLVIQGNAWEKPNSRWDGQQQQFRQSGDHQDQEEEEETFSDVDCNGAV